MIIGGPEDRARVSDDPKFLAEAFHAGQIDTRDFRWGKRELNGLPVGSIDGVEQATGVATHPPSLCLEVAEPKGMEGIAIDGKGLVIYSILSEESSTGAVDQQGFAFGRYSGGLEVSAGYRARAPSDSAVDGFEE